MPDRDEAVRKGGDLSLPLPGSGTTGKGSRRKSREAALQALFLAETHPATPFEQSLEVYTENFPVRSGSQAHFFRLVRGVWEEKEAIDRLIKTSAEHWRIERMSGVDRNILRLAVFELIHCPDIPPRVAINEAIDLGKQYGSEESGAFVNGILDRIFLEQSGKTGKETEAEEGP
ncbi:MAG: transcription antitermination factor NusB [Thermodesulfobacteriota bacterium]